jgi:ABC-2 type transport system ATP-binding protein
MRDLARQGRAVLVSSHLMAEMALTAEHLIVIGRGRLIADTATTDFIASTADDQVLVRAAVAEDAQALRRRLESGGAVVKPAPGGGFLAGGLDATRIGLLAAAAGLALGELTPQRSSLEDAFMEATKRSVQFRASTDAAPDTAVRS